MLRRLVAIALASLTAPGLAQVTPASNTAAAASRDLWLATEGRYVRQWQLLGPMSPADADALAPFDQPNTLGTDPSKPWRTMGTYGDLLDGFSAGGMQPGDAGLALATVRRERAGKATLLVGGNVRGVWVNGAWLAGAESTLVFRIDGNVFDANLVAGENRILLRVERVDDPVLLTLRVVEPGFVDGVAGRISPALATVADGTLLLYPGTAAIPRLPEVGFEVIAPGGRVVATAAAARDTVATLATRDWPDGPYEVRVTGQNELGTTQITHLPWYKGDAAADAQKLVDAAAAAGASAHLRMLADMVRDRAHGDWRALHSPLMEYAELLLERSGKTGGERAGGFVRLAWTDDIDGSTQFCRAYLPAEWPAQQPAAALAFLHGYNPPNPPYVRWWSIADRHNGVAERNGLVVLEPMGRGNVDYRWMGERDVLKCIEVARLRFHLDEDRVYVTGESMGGNGTWLLASRHPDVFAAAAPVFGGQDYRINQNGYAYTNPEGTRPMERFIHEAHSSFAGAEGLLHVPLYVLHGDIDPAVSVDFSRHGVGLLQRWGYDVRYREIPGRGHEDLKARDEIAAWLLEHRRANNPREVRLRSYDLAGASAYWVRVSSWENPFELMEVRATIVGNDTVRLDTKNVAALSLTPPLPLRGAPLTVIWNGQKVLSEHPKTGVYGLAIEGYAPRGTLKHARREGRLTYFFNTPFAIVVGTSSKDPAMTRVIEQKAAALADLWERWQHAKPRVFRDTEITPQDAQRYSLLLLGGPTANTISARLAPKLPLKVAEDSVTIDGRRFAASDAVAQMLYPHPANDQRYVLLVAPTSAAGLRYWDPQQYWHALNGFPMNFWDWTVVDGRRATQASGLLPDRRWVAAGVFDHHWRRDDRFVVTGAAQLRADAPLREAPSPGFKLPNEDLDQFVGRYRINPGQLGGGGLINVTRDGETLSATAPENGRNWPLEAEDANNFAIAGLGTPVNFLRDVAGSVTGLIYDYNGQSIVATRIP
jgi:poly(3-hydroxybutyrate) depolymerase